MTISQFDLRKSRIGLKREAIEVFLRSVGFSYSDLLLKLGKW